MSWPRPQSHFSYNFEYELRTQQIPGGVPVTEPVHGRWFQLPNPGTYTAQIRAKVRAKRWTAWSPPQTFACDPDESSHTRAWRTAVLAALGALLLVLAVVVVCRRCGLLGRVFPRLPPMKDPLADAPQDGQLMPWEAGQEECPVSEVQLVSEK
ncbi:PREDICTED: interleukin-3 receptor subunit alpha-like [Chinchilla lanigera]|uniref:interleukin-3 receptor subunit alpha-like n=1 Tax=Chinchilla lanigera TaxID=34839 RepID=UPI0006985764|nr:PREDICTED: interleukin-3 receptor subunit alpha-like [Chinchilla lanigera]